MNCRVTHASNIAKSTCRRVLWRMPSLPGQNHPRAVWLPAAHREGLAIVRDRLATVIPGLGLIVRRAVIASYAACIDYGCFRLLVVFPLTRIPAPVPSSGKNVTPAPASALWMASMLAERAAARCSSV